MRMSVNTETKLGWFFLILAVVIALITPMCDARAETISFQTPDPNRNCPKPHPTATMSVSIWNSGGWPLWKKYCWYSTPAPGPFPRNPAK
jgi:hypothetical protein